MILAGAPERRRSAALDRELPGQTFDVEPMICRIPGWAELGGTFARHCGGSRSARGRGESHSARRIVRLTASGALRQNGRRTPAVMLS